MVGVVADVLRSVVLCFRRHRSADRAAFDRALERLSAAGVRSLRLTCRSCWISPRINAKGGLAAREAYLYHRSWLEQRGGEYDPRVLVRILKGEAQTRCRLPRGSAAQDANSSSGGRHAPRVSTPSSCQPSRKSRRRLDELATDEAYGQDQSADAPQPTIANMLDRCAISVPCHATLERRRLGFMLMGNRCEDHRLLKIAGLVDD